MNPGNFPPPLHPDATVPDPVLQALLIKFSDLEHRLENQGKEIDDINAKLKVAHRDGNQASKLVPLEITIAPSSFLNRLSCSYTLVFCFPDVVLAICAILAVVSIFIPTKEKNLATALGVVGAVLPSLLVLYVAYRLYRARRRIAPERRPHTL